MELPELVDLDKSWQSGTMRQALTALNAHVRALTERMDGQTLINEIVQEGVDFLKGRISRLEAAGGDDPIVEKEPGKAEATKCDSCGWSNGQPQSSACGHCNRVGTSEYNEDGGCYGFDKWKPVL